MSILIINIYLGRVPAGVCQSWLLKSSGVRSPPSSVLVELQTGGGGVGRDAPTEDIPCESVPCSGLQGYWGQRKSLIAGGDVDLSFIVRSYQNSWNS